FKASHEVVKDEISQVDEREVAVALAPLMAHGEFEVAIVVRSSVDDVHGARIREELLRERDRLADPEPALQSDDVVVAVQLPRRRNRGDNRRVAEEPAVPPRKTQRAEPRRDDDVDLPARVLPCEVTREYLRLSRTRESLAFDGLLVELDVRGAVSAQGVGERRVEPGACLAGPVPPTGHRYCR